jgi:aspartyl-tRNA(Asn)/glutamyl-tRNA(Gln) amidotransferase subunit A
VNKLNILEKNSLKEKTASYLSKIKLNHQLNAFLQVFEDDALQRAADIQERFNKGEKIGKLAGTVIAVKDIIAIKSKELRCSSKILKGFTSLYNSTAVERLIAEDAVLIGRTNCDEFAMGSSNENSAYGAVLNPINLSHVPGGSSGGSAAAVAAILCDAALGTDTGGSIRQPAAFCGVFGIKPTYGRVSRFGLVAFASSFDSIGAIANSTTDCAEVLEVISGYDTKDSTSLNMPVPEFSKLVFNGIKGLRIGVPKEYFQTGLDEEIRAAINQQLEFLTDEGCEIIEVSLPHTEYSIATYYILTTAEASANLARYDGARYGQRQDSKELERMYVDSRNSGLGKEVKRRIMLGTYILSAGYYDAYYLKAQRVRRLIQNDFKNVFKKVDCILTPTTPTAAFKLGEKISDPLSMYLSDIYTTSANLAGIPGMNIPIGINLEGLPIGMQIMSDHFKEEVLFKISYFIEQKNIRSKTN